MSERSELNEIEIGVRLSKDKFRRNIYAPIKDIGKYRKMYNNKGVYVSAYCYTNGKEKTEDSLLYGHLYLDLDNPDLKDKSQEKEAFETIREDGVKAISFLSAIIGIDEEMIKIYFSGQKGLHIIVPATILGIRPMKELNHVFKTIAKDIHKMSKHKTIDTQIYDNARLFSLPGVIHPATGLYKIPLTFDELRTMPFTEIKKLAKNKRKMKYKDAVYSTKANRMFKNYCDEWEREKVLLGNKSKKKGVQTLNFLPPCIESILTKPCTQGYRNHTTAALSSYYKSRGYSKDKAWKELEQWNDEFAKLPKGELSTTFESIFNGGYTYGCSTLETLGDCCREKCKIGTNRIKKEKEAQAKLNNR